MPALEMGFSQAGIFVCDLNQEEKIESRKRVRSLEKQRKMEKREKIKKGFGKLEDVCSAGREKKSKETSFLDKEEIQTTREKSEKEVTNINLKERPWKNSHKDNKER